MITFFYVPQYFTTQLSVAGGIDDSQTTGIVLQDISGVDATKPGIIALTWSNPIDTTKIEYIFYTSINESTKELQGVTRGQEGYSAKSHLNGATVAWPLSKSHINNIPDSTTTFTNKDLTSETNTFPSNGWTPARETWEYVSVDDPTGIFRVNADVTGKYSAGMRIKFTNATNVIYGIITTVGAYTGGYTSITFLHQIDPTDSLALYLMANSAITANYYSTQKTPFGFPSEPTKWSVEITSTADKTVSTPNDTYKQFGDLSITIPIGCWNVLFKGVINFEKTSLAYVGTYFGLSTATNSASDLNLIIFDYADIVGDTGNKAFYHPFLLSENIALTTKTAYYPIGRGYDANITTLALKGNFGKTIIRAICAYL